MSTTSKELSFNDLLSFLDWVAKIGKMKPSTARALKAASNKVLEILNENEKSDLSKINIDETFDRFKNLNSQGLTPDSLKSYRSRTKKAVYEFLSYKNDPENWKPSIPQRSRQSTTNNVGKKTDTKSSKDAVNYVDKSRLKDKPEEPSLTHQYPLRNDITIKIVGLPRDLKLIEAKRLSAFLTTLCEDYAPEV